MSKELIGSHSVHETLVRQTQIDAARIEELERELECERIRLAACGVAALGYFDGCKDEYRSASLDDTLRLVEKNDQLRAHINDLREALTHSDTLLRDLPNSGGFYGLGVMENNAEALASIPEQSIAEYRNKVIEAFVNEFSRHVGGDGEFWLHELQEFAMKEQP